MVFAPTPLPPEATPNEFIHPSGAFTVLLPRTWAVYDQATPLFADAAFAPPDSEVPLVQISVVNLGDVITTEQFGNLVTQYQSQVRPDLINYTEQERQAMGDGSWRISGLRQTAAQQTEQLNTFIQHEGALFAVMTIILPTDATLRSQVQTIINTFTLNAAADLPVADLMTLSGAAQSRVTIVNLATWTAPDGVFYVTGEVTNTGNTPLVDLPVRATLLTEANEIVADAVDIVMGHAIESGGFAPFSIRFGQGQPNNAARYRVSLGSDDYSSPGDQAIISAPTLSWVDATQSNAEGALFVTGEVTNEGEADVLMPRAIVTVFDDTGRIIAAGFADADITLLPAGETANFTVLMSDLGGTPSNYVVNVQALACDASCE